MVSVALVYNFVKLVPLTRSEVGKINFSLVLTSLRTSVGDARAHAESGLDERATHHIAPNGPWFIRININGGII